MVTCNGNGPTAIPDQQSSLGGLLLALEYEMSRISQQAPLEPFKVQLSAWIKSWIA